MTNDTFDNDKCNMTNVPNPPKHDIQAQESNMTHNDPQDSNVTNVTLRNKIVILANMTISDSDERDTFVTRVYDITSIMLDRGEEGDNIPDAVNEAVEFLTEWINVTITKNTVTFAELCHMTEELIDNVMYDAQIAWDLDGQFDEILNETYFWAQERLDDGRDEDDVMFEAYERVESWILEYVSDPDAQDDFCQIAHDALDKLLSE